MPKLISKTTLFLLLIGWVHCSSAGVAEPFLFKSMDNGKSWSPAGAGLGENQSVNGLGSFEDTVFAGTNTGIYFSKDQGQSWNPASIEGDLTPRVLCISRTSKDIVFAGTDGAGLLESKDQGQTWTLNTKFPSLKVRCIVANQNELYLGTDTHGVYVSSDQGQHWSQLNQGLPEKSQVFAMTSIHDQLFAALYSQGLYGWEASTQSWKKAGEVSPLVLSATSTALIAGHNPGGVFRSDDLGFSWEKGMAESLTFFDLSGREESDKLSSNAPVWEGASSENFSIIGASDGVFYSLNHGITWTRSTTGLPPNRPGIAFLVMPDYVLASISNQGTSR